MHIITQLFLFVNENFVNENFVNENYHNFRGSIFSVFGYNIIRDVSTACVMKGVTDCMELIKISNRKLKIMLTPTDMCHFELNTDSFGEDSVQMHRSFRLLLEEVRKQTDFDADDEHLSVQYFPSREGGCEMFISHLESAASDSSASRKIPPLLPPEKSAVQVKKRKQSGSFRKDCAYRFERLEYLLNVCKRLLNIDCLCDSAVYRDEHGIYFLFLTVFSASPFSVPEELDFVVEYGKIETASLLRLYIQEHALPICRHNAIFKLASLA